MLDEMVEDDGGKRWQKKDEIVEASTIAVKFVDGIKNNITTTLSPQRHSCKGEEEEEKQGRKIQRTGTQKPNIEQLGITWFISEAVNV